MDQPEVSGDFQADNLRLGTVEGVALRIEADYHPSRMLLREARVTWSGQTLLARGTVGFEEARTTLDLRAQTQQTSLSSILRALNKNLPIEGMVAASATIGGTAEAPVANLDISATGVEAYQEPFGDMRVRATLANQQLHLTELHLDKPNGDGTTGTLQATGSYNLDQKTYAFEATSSDLKLTRLTMDEGNSVKGTVGLRASGNGTVDDPRLDIALNAEGLTVGGRDIGAVSLAGDLEGKQASLRASVPKFRIKGSAEVQSEAPYRVEFKLGAKQTDLSTLELTLKEDEPLTGMLSAAIEGSGALDNWRDAAAQVVISDLQLIVGKQQVWNEGPLALRYEQRTVSVDGGLAMDDSHIRAEGSLPLDGAVPPGAVQIEGDLNLDTLISLIPTEQPTAAQGRLQIKGSLEGTLQSLQPTLDLTVRQAGFFNPAIISPLFGVDIDARYDQGALELTNLQAEWAGAKISGNGTLPLGLLPVENLSLETPAREGPAAFQLSMQGFIVDSISDLPPGLGGTISLTTNLEAPTLKAEFINGKVVFDELRFNYESFEIRQEAPATLSFSQGRFQIESFTLTGPNSKLQASGGVTLGESNTIDARVEGSTDIGVLTLASDAIAARGGSQFSLAVGGTLAEPQFSGRFALQNAQLNLATPSVQLQDLNVNLAIAPERITVEQMAGNLNGGSFQAGGSISYKGLEISQVDLNLAAHNVFLDYPEGLDTLLDSKLQIQSRDELINVGGNLQIVEGSYTRPVEINQLLFDYLRSGESVDFVAEPNPLLSRVRYGVDISTDGPIIIDNNIAQLAADANLRLTGAYYRPGLTGRLTLQEGGELLLAENRYVIDRGTIDFGNETRIQPSVDIVARTQIRRRYDIELQINGGGPVPVTTTLTSSSHPELSEPDLISLLLTGREREDLRGQETTVAARQSLSLLTGQIGGRISRGAEQALGLSEVRIEPNLIAAESDPGARLTVGQNLTTDLSLVYSMNLADSSDQIWIARYDLTRRFQAEAVKQEDNSYRTEFRHDVRFGGAPDTGRVQARRPPRIASIDFQNQFGLSEEELRDKLGLESGKPYDFFKLRRGSEKLERSLAEGGFLESTVRVHRQNTEESSVQVDLVVGGNLGPQVEIVFEGASLPAGVRDEVRKVWRDGIFELQRADDSVKVVRRYLVREGYFESKIDHGATGADAGTKRIVFSIQTGPRYRDVQLRFAGNTAFTEDELRELLNRAKLQIAVHVESQRVMELLEQSYRQQGYLDVKVARPEYKLDPGEGSGEVVIAIEEGPQYRIAGVTFQGNKVLSELALRSVLPFGIAHVYRPEFLREALNRMEERYWRDGYNDVVVNFRVTRSQDEGTVQVAFDIQENKQGVIQTVSIEGNNTTSESLVRGQLNLEPNEPLNFEKLARSRKNLYDTGAYALVDIKAEPIQAGDPSIAEGQKPLELQVRLREVKPYQIRYGAFFDTERGPGIIADFTNRNILGSARVLGLRTRYDADDKEARLYFSQPILRRLPLRSTALLFVRRQDQGTFITDTKGLSLLQEARFGNSLILNYGYRYERNHTFEVEPDPFFPFDERVSLAPLTATLSRESRDALLDATRGSFTSHAISYASTKFGSDLGFIKYFGQYFKYIPLLAAREEPYGGPLERPRLVYAGGVRVGLGKGLGGLDLVTSERFFAGGGTSIRGFQQDTVGPTFFDEPGEDPTGGDAVFILNNELRFPLISIFDGVGFVDIGNVYKKASDFNPFEVRKAAGVGLRVRTPYFLLRADYGFKLDRKPGESLGAFFFSIGQAF
jgi:outer membrane protein assembly complex protein YaeT